MVGGLKERLQELLENTGIIEQKKLVRLTTVEKIGHCLSFEQRNGFLFNWVFVKESSFNEIKYLTKIICFVQNAESKI